MAGEDLIKSNSNSQYGEMNAVLTQNGAKKGAIVADTEVKYDTGSSTLETNSGDQFQITTEWDGQGDVSSDDTYGRTTFSGFCVS